MILDSLSRWHRYAPLHPRFPRAFAFLEAAGPDVPVGRVAIDGESIHAIVQGYRTRDPVGAQLEAHRRYIDIQYVVRGREAIHWATLGSLGPATVPYEAEKDAALYAPTGGVVPLPLAAGHFAILFPDDAHAPCCTWDEPADVLKIVVKVEI